MQLATCAKSRIESRTAAANENEKYLSFALFLSPSHPPFLPRILSRFALVLFSALIVPAWSKDQGGKENKSGSRIRGRKTERTNLSFFPYPSHGCTVYTTSQAHVYPHIYMYEMTRLGWSFESFPNVRPDWKVRTLSNNPDTSPCNMFDNSSGRFSLAEYREKLFAGLIPYGAGYLCYLQTTDLVTRFRRSVHTLYTIVLFPPNICNARNSIVL